MADYNSGGTTSPALGAAGGAVVGALKGGLGWIALTTVTAGALTFALFSGLLIPALAAANLSLSTILLTGLGAAAGGAFGLLTYPVFAGAGAVYGGVTGASRASERAQQSQMQQLEQQMVMEQVRQQAYGYPPQGSRMNPAMSSIQLGGLQRDGVVVPETSLQRA